MEKVFMTWLGYTKQKVQENIDFVKLMLFVLLLTHVMACLWITIGYLSDQGWVDNFLEEQKEVYKIHSQKHHLNDEELKFEARHFYCLEIYVNAAYFILTTITTVGYGDISGNNKNEYMFSMCVQFVGLTFFSFLTGTINVMFSGS